MRLAGRYRFVAVDTTLRKGNVGTTDLQLNVADTLQRFYERLLGNYRRVGDKPLAGNFLRRDKKEVFRESVVIQRNPTATVMVSGVCDCNDATLVYYTIAAITPNGFVGRWHDPQTGIGRIADRNGNYLPDPAGHFCAIRD
jgi:hypothetical protein